MAASTNLNDLLSLSGRSLSEAQALQVATHAFTVASEEVKLHMREWLLIKDKNSIVMDDGEGEEDALERAFARLIWKSPLSVEQSLSISGIALTAPLSSSEAAGQLAMMTSSTETASSPRRRDEVQRTPAAPQKKRKPSWRIPPPAAPAAPAENQPRPQQQQNQGTFGVLKLTPSARSISVPNVLPQKAPPPEPAKAPEIVFNFLDLLVPTQRELDARERLSHGIPMSHAINHICEEHFQQYDRLVLEAQEGGPEPASQKSLMPFSDSTTNSTALFPMCLDCVRNSRALLSTMTKLDGQVVMMLRSVDTCTCASRILFGPPDRAKEGRHCVHCEHSAVQESKAHGIFLRQATHPVGRPAFTADQQLMLSCACGNPAFVPQDPARQCIGCGGIKTAPYFNYKGDQLVFAAGTASVLQAFPWEDGNQDEQLKKRIDLLPALLEFNRVNARLDREQLLGTQDPVPAQTDERPTKRQAADSFTGEETKAAKKQRRRKAYDETALFTPNEKLSLRSMGIKKVKPHYHKIDNPPTALERAQLLLADNGKKKKLIADWIPVLEVCGLRAEDCRDLPESLGIKDDVISGKDMVGWVEAMVRMREQRKIVEMVGGVAGGDAYVQDGVDGL